MADVALTDIRWSDPDKERSPVLHIKAGESVSKLPADLRKELKDNGTIGEPPSLLPAAAEEKAALEDRIKELEAELEAAKNPTKPS